MKSREATLARGLVALAMAVPTVARADYIYTPSPTAASLPVHGMAFPTLAITESDLQDEGNGLFSFSVHTSQPIPVSPFFDLFGTLRLTPGGQVSEWNVTQRQGTRYYSLIAISSFEGGVFFESLEFRPGICCTTPEGPSYSAVAGTWHIGPAPAVPEPAAWALWLAGAGALRLGLRKRVAGPSGA